MSDEIISQIELVEIDQIKPNEYNPNQMTDEQFQVLVDDIKENGFVGQPIIVNGKNEIIIAAGHNPSCISAIFNQDVWKKKNVKVVGEKVPLGTGGAIRLAASRATSKTVFVCNGDTVVSDINITRIVRRHLARNSRITTILTKNEDMVQNRGAVTVQSSLVIGFEEGKSDKRINSSNASSTGCYVMNKEFILKHFPVQDGINLREISLERELLPLFVAMNMVDAFVMERNRFFIDFGNPLRYEMLKNKEGTIIQIYKKGG